MPAGAVPGLHHVTSLCRDPQRNLDFYAGFLGQRLVKRTVNFDAPDGYHLYYGNQMGSPGTLMTFFPVPNAARGHPGPGMASALACRVAPGAVDGWIRRLAGRGIGFDGPSERFGERMLVLRDPDGAPLELIETQAPETDGLHSVTLCVAEPDPTARFLTEQFGFRAAGREAVAGRERLRFLAEGGARGTVVDLVQGAPPERPRTGAGSIHHVAFRAESDEVQTAWRERLLVAGFRVTPVIDRQYFRAIYFREPGGILFEIATDPPGFAVDEAPGALGTALKLPPHSEPIRARLERVLPVLRLPGAPEGG